jgi:hypothetical protein
MKDWRKMLEGIGGYDNEMIVVPSGGVKEMVDDIEEIQQQLAAKDALLNKLHDVLMYIQPWCNGQYNGHEKCQDLIFEASEAIDKELKNGN